MVLFHKEEIIAREIKCYLEENHYVEGMKLPSEREMTTLFHAQRITLRSALQRLIHEGIIEVRDRKGYFVSHKKFEFDLNSFQSTTAVVHNMDKVVFSKILYQAEKEIGKDLSRIMEIPLGSKLYCIKRVRYLIDHENKIPIAIETSYVPMKLFPELMNQDMSNKSLYEMAECEYNIKPKCFSRIISTVYANKEEAELLEVHFKMPLLYQNGHMLTENGEFMEYIESLMRPDYFAFVKKSIPDK